MVLWGGIMRTAEDPKGTEREAQFCETEQQSLGVCCQLPSKASCLLLSSYTTLPLNVQRCCKIRQLTINSKRPEGIPFGFGQETMAHLFPTALRSASANKQLYRTMSQFQRMFHSNRWNPNYTNADNYDYLLGFPRHCGCRIRAASKFSRHSTLKYIHRHHVIA